jgi:hypothetical protein
MKDNLKIVKNRINQNANILSAIMYGSSNYNIKSVDIDILIIIPSEFGIVSSNVYIDAEFKL